MSADGGKVALLPAVAPRQQNTTYHIMFHDTAWLCFSGLRCCWQQCCVPSPARGPPTSRDFPFGGWIRHAFQSRAEVFSRRMDANKPCYTQIMRLAFLDAAGAQEGPGGRKLDL
ncbi:hypothetical protein NDU88_000162 [Pleurodeles waltl]|uniref:Uncharacterized protein n=1 Tax=Pleurodeles waltl TaxID=8319 RepID=A0AAV7V672_PLEWA|nr:hypothetical protein NDU88_000162 [Pleurodeles waltl]